MRFPAGVTVTVLRSGGRDRFGNVLPESTYALAGCSVAPRGSSEPLDRSDTVVEGAVLRGPGSSPTLAPTPTTGAPTLTSTDRVTVTGMTTLDGMWAIEGEVGPWRSPFTGWTPGWRVALKRGA